jgi:hypothetical protein
MSKELNYYSSQTHHVYKVVICNHVLFSTPRFLPLFREARTKYLRKFMALSATTFGSTKSMLHALGLAGRNVDLGLANFDAIKMSPMCKWIIHAMDHGKFNLQLMLHS